MKSSTRVTIQNWNILRVGGVATITLYPVVDEPLVGDGTYAVPRRRKWWAEQASVYGRVEFVDHARALVRDADDYLHEIRSGDRRGGIVEGIGFRGDGGYEQQQMYYNWNAQWLATLDARREQMVEEASGRRAAGKSEGAQAGRLCHQMHAGGAA